MAAQDERPTFTGSAYLSAAASGAPSILGAAGDEGHESATSPLRAGARDRPAVPATRPGVAGRRSHLQLNEARGDGYALRPAVPATDCGLAGPQPVVAPAPVARSGLAEVPE